MVPMAYTMRSSLQRMRSTIKNVILFATCVVNILGFLHIIFGIILEFALLGNAKGKKVVGDCHYTKGAPNGVIQPNSGNKPSPP